MWKRMQAVWQTIKRLGPTAKALWPKDRMVRSLLVTAGMVGLAVLAFFLGRSGFLSKAEAQVSEGLPTIFEPSSGLEKRVVALIHGNVQVTREELGEYLIARFGKERTEFLVNRKIVDLACKGRGIYVTDGEIDAQLELDLQAMGGPTRIPRKDFETQILRRFSKTLFEWREDVIRPKLQLAKLVRPSIVVTEEDMRKAFEVRYHEKVQCRMIVLEENNRHAFDIWEKVSKDEKAFEEYARKQFLQPLAAKAGEVPPIHKHFGYALIEKEAFLLKDGEVSKLMEMPDKTVLILRREKLIPADPTVRLDQVREKLHREIVDFKLAQEIPQAFAELRKQARPEIFLRPDLRQEDMERRAQHSLNPGAPPAAPVMPATPPTRPSVNPPLPPKI